MGYFKGPLTGRGPAIETLFANNYAFGARMMRTNPHASGMDDIA
jgi:hypothetical protein